MRTTKIGVVALALAASGSLVNAASVGVRAPELKVRGAAWTHYNMGDSPEGGYMGWLRDQVSSVQGEVELPETLPPAAHRFFLKSINYGDRVSVQLRCGGGESKIVSPNNRDWNGYWTEGVPVRLLRADSKLLITLSKPAGSSNTEKLLLRGLYITDDPEVVVDGNDTVIRTPRSLVVDESPPVKGNRIGNSSFEVGLGYGWGHLAASNYNRDHSIKSLWDTSQAHHGRASWRLPPWGAIVSRVLRVAPNKRHTLSLWAKPSRPKAVLQVSLYNVHQRLEGLRAPTRLQQRYSLEAPWRRLTLTGALMAHPTDEFQIRIEAADQPVWIDAIQLEEGDASEYRTKAPLEVGLVCGAPSNIFFEDEPAVMSLWVCNSSGESVAAPVRWELYDYLNRKVKEAGLEVAAAPAATTQANLDLSPGKRGVFRLVVWIDGRDGSDEEVVFCVVPRPRVAGPDPDSIIGIHANASECQCSAAAVANCCHSRICGNGQSLRLVTFGHGRSETVPSGQRTCTYLAHGFAQQRLDAG